MPAEDKQILSEAEIQKAISRLAHEILEKNKAAGNIVLVGIRTRGVFLAERLQKEIEKIQKTKLPLGVVDITLYRDDLGEIGANPEVRETTLPFDVKGKIVVLVDDVLFTGRTIRAALDAVIDYGRPKAIQLAVLIDRGHRELPIKADYVGKNIPTAAHEQVILKLKEKDGSDVAVLVTSEAKKSK